MASVTASARGSQPAWNSSPSGFGQHAFGVRPAAQVGVAEVAHRAGSSGRPVPIIESRVTSAASCSSLEAFGAGRAHRQHQVAHLGGGIDDADLGAFGQRRRRSRRARRAGPSPRASGRARSCTRWAAGPAPARGSSCTACTPPCGAAAACSPAPPCARPGGRCSPARRWPRWRRAAASRGRPASAQARATTRAPLRGPILRLVGVDQHVQRGRVDVALLRQHRLQRAHAQVHLAEFAVLVVVRGRGSSPHRSAYSSPAMKALQIHAGATALKHLRERGLQPADVRIDPRGGRRPEGADPERAGPLPLRRLAGRQQRTRCICWARRSAPGAWPPPAWTTPAPRWRRWPRTTSTSTTSTRRASRRRRAM